nr:RPM1-interacting protein 4-like isoform X2 [Ipomoea batatas]GMC76390.1 RPM1-interacting protein 4-like isoform X2 [Ipomoea batatas]
MRFMSDFTKVKEKGRPLPKFGEWDVNDPASAEGFTVIFNKARDEKKTGGQPESPTKTDAHTKHAADQSKPTALPHQSLLVMISVA